LIAPARWLWLFAALLGWGGGATAADQAIPLEYQVKAAYLAKFVPFVEWPAGAMPEGAPINLCVAGDDPFGPTLAALSGQAVGARAVAPRRLTRVEPGSDCHVIYIRGSRTQSVADALQALKGRPVLTVTDAASGAAGRGVLHFVVAQNRVRFEVDAQAAAENNLAVSSKLQSLALAVRRR